MPRTSDTHLMRKAPAFVFQLCKHEAFTKENRATAGPDQSLGVGDLIASLLRAGYSIKQIRAMFPGLFTSIAGPGG